MLPSARLNVETSELFTPGPAVGAPFAVSGGHVDVHPPVHLLPPGGSELSMYSGWLEVASTVP